LLFHDIWTGKFESIRAIHLHHVVYSTHSLYLLMYLLIVLFYICIPLYLCLFVCLMVFNTIRIASKVNMLDNVYIYISINTMLGRRGRDRMVVGFTTTYAISAYHH
jgi:hypothetical protein